MTSRAKPRAKPRTRPTRIRILGREFKIRQVAKIDSDNSVGECCATDRLIKIKSGLSDDLFEATLLHESLHGALGISGQAEHLEDPVEEGIVIAIEHALSELYSRK